MAATARPGWTAIAHACSYADIRVRGQLTETYYPVDFHAAARLRPARGGSAASFGPVRKPLMKSSIARGWTRSRVPLLAVLALAASLGLAGCENDGGSPPPPDGGGGSGGGGPGPTGPADPPIVNGGPVRNMGNGSALTAQQITDIGGLVTTLDSATISSNKPVIEFTVKTARGGAVTGLAATTLRMTVAKLVPASGNL